MKKDDMQNLWDDGIRPSLDECAAKVSEFEKEAGLPKGATASAAATTAGSVVVAAFVEAWPRLRKPVMGVGYAACGYVLYKLAQAAFSRDSTPPGRTEADDLI